MRPAAIRSVIISNKLLSTDYPPLPRSYYGGHLISARGALLSRDTAADNITQLALLLLPRLARWADPGLLLMLVLRSAAGDKLEAAADQLL